MASGSQTRVAGQIVNRVVTPGKPVVPDAVVTVINTTAWSFPSPRPKPSDLAPTAGNLSRTIRSSVETHSPRPTTNGSVYYGTATYVGLSLVSTNTNSQGRAQSAALQAISKMSSFNAAADVGEGRETANMIAKRARQLAEAFGQLKKGNPFGFFQALGLSGSRRSAAAIAKHGLKEAPNLWLEYTYGWKPLVSDVYEGLSRYREGMHKRGYVVQRTSGRIKGPPSPADLAGTMGDLGYSGSTRATVSNPTVATLNEFGLLNPLSLAWELMPYSFVVDWFAPVGNIIGSITAGAGYTNHHHCITYEIRGITRSPENGYVSVVSQDIHREAYNPQTALASFGSLIAADLGWQRVTSAVSLLAQRFGRK